MAYETTAAAATSGNPYAIVAAAIFDTVRASAKETTTSSGKKTSQLALTPDMFSDMIKQVVGSDQGLEKLLGGGSAAGNVFADALSKRSAGQFGLLTAPTIESASSKTTSKRSVICSELVRQGQLHPFVYAAGAGHFAALSPKTVNGYYSWGVPAVKLMQRSSLITKFFGYVARCRYLYIITGEFNFVGWFTVKIGEPFCYLIGRK
jgi:hypothetical protein